MKNKTKMMMAAVMVTAMLPMTKVEAAVTPTDFLPIPKEYNEYYERNLEIISKQIQQEGAVMGENGELETVFIQVEGEAFAYEVQSGDTLSEIAEYFMVSMEQLLELNPEIKIPDLIYVGQSIQLNEATEVNYD